MPTPPTRLQQIQQLLPELPKFRLRQVNEALFDPMVTSWSEVTTLPKAMRDTLMDAGLPWISTTERLVLRSANGDTYKAALQLAGGELVETVLMRNARDQWSICVSSQVGCAMACSFCATGKMGFTRNLTSDEIIDQYRFWMYWLKTNAATVGTSTEERAPAPQLTTNRISNVVFMGMGEPLANYENIKTTIRTWLEYTDIGPTHITVSTVGVLPMMERLLADVEWPHTRLAVSLHSADKDTRKSVVPTSSPAFMDALSDWSRRYIEKYGNRRHHLTFEHVMLAGVNDTEEHARQLANFANKIGHVRINLIPWNTVGDTPFAKSQEKQIALFVSILQERGVTVTVRRNMGTDIAAACGQLANETPEQK